MRRCIYVRTCICRTFLHLLYHLWDLLLVNPVYTGDCVESRRNIVHNQHLPRPSHPLCGGNPSYSYPFDQVSTKSSLYDEFLVHDLHVGKLAGDIGRSYMLPYELFTHHSHFQLPLPFGRWHFSSLLLSKKLMNRVHQPGKYISTTIS